MNVREVIEDVTSAGTVVVLTCTAVTLSQVGTLGIIGAIVIGLLIVANITKELPAEPAKSERTFFDLPHPLPPSQPTHVFDSFKAAKAAQEARLARHVQS